MSKAIASTVVVDVPPPDGVETALQMRPVAEQVAKIVTAEDAQRAGLFLRAVRTAIKDWQDAFKSARRPFRQRIDKLAADEKEVLRPYQQLETLVAAPLMVWQIEDKARVETERKAQLALAEENARAKRDEQAQALDRAALVAKGDNKKVLQAQARAVRQAPITPEVTSVIAEITKIAGISVGAHHEAVVNDFGLLVKAVADGLVPIAALQPNQDWLDEQATGLGTDLNYPGVSVVTSHSQRVRKL